jgi:hypothetical protein
MVEKFDQKIENVTSFEDDCRGPELEEAQQCQRDERVFQTAAHNNLEASLFIYAVHCTHTRITVTHKKTLLYIDSYCTWFDVSTVDQTQPSGLHSFEELFIYSV